MCIQAVVTGDDITLQKIQINAASHNLGGGNSNNITIIINIIIILL